jgi:hypothetical protein
MTKRAGNQGSKAASAVAAEPTRAGALRGGVFAAGLVAIAAVAALPGLLACETQPPYAACDLDKEVVDKGVCTGESTTATGTTSCVVTKHPHCIDGVCLSYFGTSAVCTRACTSDGDCSSDGGFCWSFSDTERYCVPKDREK